MNSKSATKQFDDLTKSIAKEQRQLKADRLSLRRETIKIKATSADLERRNAEATTELDKLHAELEITKLRNDELKDKNEKLERSNNRLDVENTELARQFAEVTQELTDKKASLDKELEEYSLIRKQEIKAEILKVNEELLSVESLVAASNLELETKKTELAGLQQIYIDEQTELRDSNQETKRLLAENKEQQAAIKDEIEASRRELQELDYKKNEVNISLAKAKEQHDKFLTYEKQARQVLDAKDRQLQDKAAELSQSSQFLQNQRSFLPPM